MNKTEKLKRNYNTRKFLYTSIFKDPPAPGKMKTGRRFAKHQDDQGKTDPVLLKAHKIISDYARATGANVGVQDHNYNVIPEMLNELLGEKNVCLHCIKYKERAAINKIQDLKCTRCYEMHTNAIKEAHRFEGSYIYMCELGFLFWTSPLYSGGRFIGSVTASGFLGIGREETAAQMFRMASGDVPTEDIEKNLAVYPRGDPQKIKALAELLLVCAESLSSGAGNYYETPRRRAAQQAELSAKIEELKTRYPADGPAPRYPLDKERLLLLALHRGERKTALRILNEILAILLFSNPDEFKFIQFRAIELVALLFRSDNAVYNRKTLLETNNHYSTRIQEAKNIEELTDILYMIVDRMASRFSSFQGIRHAPALKKAEQFINENYTMKISLKEIAKASGLSAPYFSTIFKDEMGENLPNYLNRLRVEKAYRLLINTDSSLSKIAGLCGFEDQSWFSKIFKKFTGITPGEYRNRGGGPLEEITEDNFSENYRIVTMKE
jgi:AraC-like DNA-binding protein/ligand-binding sensor protein